jgi:hypothetical protein
MKTRSQSVIYAFKLVDSSKKASTLDFWEPNMKQAGAETQRWAFFSDLPDPRVTGRTAHDLFDNVALALRAVMAGAEGWDDIEEWGGAREAGCANTCHCATGYPVTTRSGGSSSPSPRWYWKNAL